MPEPPKDGVPRASGNVAVLAAGDIAPGAMTEHLTDDWAFFVRSSRQFEKFRSPFQSVEVHDSATFGKLFRLDGHFMTSERDEFFYHETLVHVAAVTHPLPERALIIGGGDGGSAEEIFKHPSIKSVTLVEIDLAVVDISRKYLQRVHRGALDDARMTLKIEDGFAFVRNATEHYDLVVLDLTDAGGPSTELYTPEFYRACAARLSPMGAMTLHIASPVADPQQVRTTLAHLRGAFSTVAPYLTSVPLYGGMWMMACCSALLDPRGMTPLQVDRRIAQRGLADLQYYNGDTHRASFALPNFVRALVA
ncbi:MAG: polyamine aminopropyltransferase [Burkholderiales bacterium]|nr:polyamine aminopropyltransferase [Burkholderiales bacterium]